MTNAKKLISQSEKPTPKEIIVDKKIRSDVSFLYVGTGDSVSQEKRIPRKKKNMKSLAMSPPRKDPIPNQYINRITTKKIKVFHQNYLNILLYMNH